MSDFLGIELIAELNKNLSKEKINSVINEMQKDGFDNIEIKLDIDKKALKTIEEFNKQLKGLASESAKTEKNLKRATVFDGEGKSIQNVARLREETRKLTREQSEQANRAQKNLEKQAGQAKQLEKTLIGINKDGGRSVTKDFKSDDGHLSERWVNGQLTRLTQDNKSFEKVEAQQNRIFDRIAQMRAKGLGDKQQLELFETSAATSNLKKLGDVYRQVGLYSREMSQTTTPQEKIQRTIDSLKRLQKMGEFRLPKKNMITDIEEALKKATSVEEIEKVNHTLNRLQRTLRDREKAFKDIEKLRGEGFIDPRELTETRERVRKAESPEQIQHISSHIKRLKEENRIEKSLLKESQNLAKAKQNLNLQLAKSEKEYGIVPEHGDIRRRMMQSDINGVRKLTQETQLLNKELKSRRDIENALDRHRKNYEKLKLDTVNISHKDNKEMQKLLSQISQIDPKSRNVSGQLTKLGNEFGILTHKIKDADQGLARFSKQMVSAMLRVPIYAATVAAMYSPMRAMGDAVRQTIELDSQLTVLERVSNGTIKMNDALEDSIGIADRLGNVISEVNDGLISFARQGYRGDDLTKITEVATLMSNVSDLNVEDASGSLTAAMKGFNIEAERSMHIVDALNEVDNNYAITTQQLAESLQRSAGTSSVYGSSLERNIGYTAAIGEVTRESGRIIGKQIAEFKSLLIDLKPLTQRRGQQGRITL